MRGILICMDMVTIRIPERVLIIVPLVILAAGALYLVSGSRSASFQTAQVTRGDIVAESLASGNVESPTVANLRFASAGRMTALYAKTGKQVAAGAILAKQDTAVLEAQLAQALSQVDAQQAQLQSLLDGTRPEAVAVTQAQVSADQVTVSRTQSAEADAIRNAFTVADSSLQNALDPLFSNPRTPNPNLLFFTNDSSLESALEGGRVSAGTVVSAFGTHAAAMGDDPTQLESEANAVLTRVAQILTEANTALAAAIPGQQASATQISTWSATVATSRVGVNAAISTLSSAITARQAAAATLAKDEKTLALQQAATTQASLDAQRAAVAAAQAQASALRAQIRNLEIIAPFAGTVTDTNGTVGENVSPDVVVVTLQPYQELDIKANVSEDSIVGVKVGDPVRIELDAFPRGTEFAGTVREIDPAQTNDGGAIYYQTRIGFDTQYDGIRPGMTANVWIETASSSGALSVPASALSRSATATTVRVVVNGELQTRSVVTGIESQDGRVELLSGVSEGEAVEVGP